MEILRKKTDRFDLEHGKFEVSEQPNRHLQQPGRAGLEWGGAGEQN